MSEEKIIKIITQYNNLKVVEDNYMSDNFSDTYFSLDDCRKIGFIRQDIEDKFNSGVINARERALLITSLLYAMEAALPYPNIFLSRNILHHGDLS